MPYTVEFKPRAESQYLAWKKHKPEIADCIDKLLEALETDPYHGIGRPEELHGNLHGFLSRRIAKNQWLVYDVTGSKVFVYSCHGQYSDLAHFG
ncbi:MAG: Txe/YoeB family addiction module toxin [Holophagales bacterium]|jgi:toxin YoeB|nr:Txe/YoeB family addiction module toxin [Holophagales bacterium]